MNETAIYTVVQDCGIPDDLWYVYYPNTLSYPTGLLDYDLYGVSSVSSGYFAGNENVIFDNPPTIQDLTIIAKIKNTGSFEGTIFTNYQSGVANSGFVLGVTADNKLYAESFGQNGPISFTSDFLLNDKSVVSFSKTDRQISFGIFNPNTFATSFETFNISDKSFLNSNVWRLGSTTGNPNFSTSRALFGTIENFCLFSGALRPEEINRVMLANIITGSSVTGYFIDQIKEFQPKSVGIFIEIDGTDYIEFSSPSGYNLQINNFDADFDSVNGYFNAAYETTGLSFFVNGVSEVGSTGYSVSSDYYSDTLVPNLDFIQSGYDFIGYDYFANDKGIYDVCESGNYYITGFSHNGSANTTVSYCPSGGCQIYFNGIKLVESVDFSFSGSSSLFASGNSLYEGATGVLSVVYPSGLNSYYKYSGSGRHPFYTGFSQGQSMLFINGIRQNLGDDYIEIGLRSYLNGTGLFPENNIIFNNDTGFTF